MTSRIDCGDFSSRTTSNGTVDASDTASDIRDGVGDGKNMEVSVAVWLNPDIPDESFESSR